MEYAEKSNGGGDWNGDGMGGAFSERGSWCNSSP